MKEIILLNWLLLASMFISLVLIIIALVNNVRENKKLAEFTDDLDD